MTEQIEKYYSEIAPELQLVTVKCHIPTKFSGSTQGLIAEAILKKIFKSINPKIIFSRNEEGETFCRVDQDFVEPINKQLTQRINLYK